ncbi:hypothetical protein AB1Y20_010740 [Prymnesium parvum]|uniref:Uncharacterized protein n=1 Tax=Prymnesium parvum TaxID=97485 RepID=A0AB34IRM3_PRYPA
MVGVSTPPSAAPSAAEESQMGAPAMPGLEPFDDGFIPSSCCEPGQLLRQPRPASLPPGVTVLQQALEPELARQLYEHTVQLNEPWGAYIRLEDASTLELQSAGAEPEVEALAMRVLQSLLSREAGRLLRDDLDHVHGFSVWAVLGGVGFETAYHVDYAEMYRRETNILRPPIHALTVQVSPIPEDSDAVVGGTLGLHLEGLEHYRRMGYKTRKQPSPPDAPTVDWGTDPGWTYVPYKFNQVTLSCGELPHAADKVKVWPEGLQRVVIGINSMGFIEGPTEMRLPQHSKAFKRMMQMELLAQHLGGPEQLVRKLLEMRKRKQSQQAATMDSQSHSTHQQAKTEHAV